MTEMYVLIFLGVLVVTLVCVELFADSWPARQYCTQSRLYLRKGVAHWCCGRCKDRF